MVAGQEHVRQPCGDSPLAEARGAEPDARAAAGSVGGRESGRRRSRDPARIAGRQDGRIAEAESGGVMSAIEIVEKPQLADQPAMRSGDTVRVHLKVREG